MLIIVSFIAIIALATFAYNHFSDNMMLENNLANDSTNDDSNDDVYDILTNDREAAPDFNVIDSYGNEVRLFDIINDGQPVVINFWTTWCPSCVRKMPELQDAYESFGGEVRFMAVNLTDGNRETKEGAMEFIETGGFTFPVYFDIDQSAVSAYGIRSIPVTYFINRNGYITNMHLGSPGLEAFKFELELLLLEP